MLDLDPIKDRLSAATPGTWHPVEFPAAKYVGVTAEHWDGCDMGYHVCSTEDCDPEDAVPNATFIAHAKADVEALVAEVERLRAAVERHRREAQAVNILVEPALADARLWAEVLE
jgi:hypothetical protein